MKRIRSKKKKVNRCTITIAAGFEPARPKPLDSLNIRITVFKSNPALCVRIGRFWTQDYRTQLTLNHSGMLPMGLQILRNTTLYTLTFGSTIKMELQGRPGVVFRKTTRNLQTLCILNMMS
jgi:hypothetical protein